MSESEPFSANATNAGTHSSCSPMTQQGVWRVVLAKNMIIFVVLACVAACFSCRLEYMYDNACAGDKLNSLLLVATVSGLALAGAISGFFTFSFSHTRKVGSGYCKLHLSIGHAATGLQQLVIGILLIVAVSCIEAFPPASHLASPAKCLAFAIYVSTVAYDIYDFFTLTSKTTP